MMHPSAVTALIGVALAAFIGGIQMHKIWIAHRRRRALSKLEWAWREAVRAHPIGYIWTHPRTGNETVLAPEDVAVIVRADTDGHDPHAAAAR